MGFEKAQREVGMAHRNRVVVAGLVALVALTQTRAEDWPVPRGPSREPVVYRYDPAVWAKVPRDFLDDAPACVLYAGNTSLVEPDGTIENIVHEITRLNS